MKSDIPRDQVRSVHRTEYLLGPSVWARSSFVAVSEAQADLLTLIEELAGSIQAEAEDHGVRFRLDVPADLPQVGVDQAQLQESVLDIVNNALQCLALGQVEAGEIVLRVRLASAREIEICVELRR
jgi:nitrogen-specific signal transduction histidine kinase